MYTCMILASVLVTSLVDAGVIDIEWSPRGVRLWTTSDPLRVRLGDFIRFNCPTLSNIYVLTDVRQYEQCNCTIPPDLMCLPIQRVAQCKAGDESIITINQPSGGLASVFGYEYGERYYYASFEEGKEAGPPCLPEDGQLGLRMVIVVFDNTATIPSNPSPSDVTLSRGSTRAGDTSGGGMEEMVAEIMRSLSSDEFAGIFVCIGIVTLVLLIALSICSFQYEKRTRRNKISRAPTDTPATQPGPGPEEVKDTNKKMQQQTSKVKK